MKLTNNKGYSISHLLKSPLVIILVVAVVYAVVGMLSSGVKIPPAGIAPIFPSAGIAIAAVLIYRRPALFGVFLGSFLYNTISSYNGPLMLLMQMFICVGAMAGAGAGAYLVRRFWNNEHPLSSGKDVLILIIIGAICCCAISPTVGVLSLSLGGVIPWRFFDYAWITWWLGDVTGVIVAAPFILAWNLKTPSHKNLGYKIEAILMGITTLVFCYYVFFQHIPMEYCLSIVLIYAAFRFGFRGVSTLAAVIAIFASIGTSIGTSVFTGDSTNITLIHLYAFLGVSITSALFLAGIIAERNHADEIIKDQERRIRSAFDLSFGFIGLLTPQGILLEANNTALEFAGMNPQDVIGKPFWETVWWNHSDEMQQKLQNAIHDVAQGQTVRFQAYHPDSNGSIHIIDFSLKPVKDETGKVVLLIPEGLDITERKRAEDALRESEEKYRRITENMSDIVSVIGPQGTINYASPSHSRILGENKYEVIGRSAFDSVHPEDRDRVAAEYMEGVRTKTNREVEYRVRHADGHYIWLRSSGHPYYDAAGELIGIIVNSSDITESKKADFQKEAALETLRESEEFLRETQAIARIGGWKTNPETDFLQWTEGVYRMVEAPMDYQPDLTEGLKYYVPEYVPLIRDRIMRTLNNNEQFVEEVELITSSGKRLWVELRGLAAVTDGQNPSVIGTIQDITERKRMEREIEESHRMKLMSQVASGVAHEVRNPLHAIQAITEAMTIDIDEKSDYKDYLMHIKAQVGRLSRLMKDLLDLGKPIQPSQFSQESLMEVAAASLRYWKEDHPKLSQYVQVVNNLQPDDLVLVDTNKIQQVIINLIENAAQHSPKDEDILLELSKASENYLMVKVIDKGAGLNPQEQSRVFDPFYTTRKSGTGLGLTLCKHIIESHDGLIRIVNNKNAPGCTAQFTLPAYNSKERK